MKNIKNISLIVLVAAGMASCDFLNNKPKGMTIPSATEDYEKMLNYQYIGNGLSEIPLYFTDDIKLLDNDAKAADYAYVNKADEIKNIFSFAPGQIYSPGNDDDDWNGTYELIFTLNVVANDVMDSEGGTKEMKERIQAEALFERAFKYFDLVNMYGPHYDKATASTDYGVPYIKEANINGTYERHTVQQVYDFILEDLEKAYPALPDITANPQHPTKTAAESFYARLYLYMGDYENALIHAKKAYEAHKDLLNLNDYTYQIGYTWDRVVLKTDKTQRVPDIDHPELIFWQYTSGLQGSVMLSEELRELFKKNVAVDTLDLRKRFYTSEDSVDMGRTDYFKGECAYVFYTNNMTGFTTPENLLIYAECEARIGDKDVAMDLINELRKNRIDALYYEELSASSNDEALQLVLEERRREFMMKPPFRYHDLRRFAKDPKTAKSVTHTVDGQTWTIEPDSDLWTFPVNSIILQFNPDMPQNPRGESQN